MVFDTIIVDIAKLGEYSLSTSHPRGRHKARVFRSRLGLAAADAATLRDALLRAAEDHSEDFRFGYRDVYGERYVLDFNMTTSTGTATVRSSWIVLHGEQMLRFVTCYVL
jgi:hypothetical protein